MQIIRFYTRWCNKCKIFSDKKTLGYDTDVDIDLPSYQKTLVKYQISIVPTFLALGDNGKVLGKLSNPTDLEEYSEWKKKVTRK
jgi:hypothetical protein